MGLMLLNVNVFNARSPENQNASQATIALVIFGASGTLTDVSYTKVSAWTRSKTVLRTGERIAGTLVECRNAAAGSSAATPSTSTNRRNSPVSAMLAAGTLALATSAALLRETQQRKAPAVMRIPSVNRCQLSAHPLHLRLHPESRRAFLSSLEGVGVYPKMWRFTPKPKAAPYLLFLHQDIVTRLL